MVIDSSALIAILLNEPERPRFVDSLFLADIVLLSAVNLMEARMVLHMRNEDLIADLDALLVRARARIEPVTALQSDLAFDAFRKFGRGTGHRAKLNFGNCFAYALAKERNVPLLFKGDDFVHTDIKAA